MNYDIDRDAAMVRCFQAGKKAGAWGSPADANPYRNKSAFHREAAAWESGRQVGAAERKRGAK